VDVSCICPNHGSAGPTAPSSCVGTLVTLRIAWPIRLGIQQSFNVGSMKSGTTYLWSLLSSHPSIFMSRFKQPSYFVDASQLQKHDNRIWIRRATTGRILGRQKSRSDVDTSEVVKSREFSEWTTLSSLGC
jgi:hypothetical protein